MPMIWHVPWGRLAAATQVPVLKLMEYNEATWDEFKDNAEAKTFFNLNLEERRGAEELGFYYHTWDYYGESRLIPFWPQSVMFC